MNCVRCGRPLLAPAKSIPSRQGVLAWGRVCAIKSGLIEVRPRDVFARQQPQPAEADPRQMALEAFA